MEEESVSGKVSSHSQDIEGNPPSKRSIKRQAKIAKWAEQKKIRRQNERAKKKEHRAKYANTEYSRSALKKRKMATSDCKVGIIIDLSFDDLMNDKDLSKTVKQVHRCYSINRRQPNPLQLHVTSFNNQSAKLMEKHTGFSNWDIVFHPESFEKLFDKSSLVYLSSDSENVLETVESHKYYIIGGLVDHNSKKGVCHESALEKKIHHARLPIDKFLDMKTRKVLSIVHVFEILTKVVRGSSWSDALMDVIPQRKHAEPKEIIVQT